MHFVCKIQWRFSPCSNEGPRHGSAAMEILTKSNCCYMCARSPLQSISMYVSWQVGSWIPPYCIYAIDALVQNMSCKLVKFVPLICMRVLQRSTLKMYGTVTINVPWKQGFGVYQKIFRPGNGSLALSDLTDDLLGICHRDGNRHPKILPWKKFFHLGLVRRPSFFRAVF